MHGHAPSRAYWFPVFGFYAQVDGQPVVYTGKKVTSAAHTLGTKGTEGRETAGAQQKGR